MNKPLISEEVVTMQVPSAPPAYDDEFKPPAANPPPYNLQMGEGCVQTSGQTSYTGVPYPQQMYMQPPAQSYAVMAQPPQQPATQIVTQTERVFLGSLPVGPQPLTTTCPHCQANIKTKTKSTTHCSAHLICLLLLCTVICCCYSCIPYCMDSFHTVHHHCPNCKAFLGAYQKH